MPANKRNNTRKKVKLTPQMESVKWKPGQSGNPNGRPKKKPITEMYERLLQEPEFVAQVEKSIRAMVQSGRMVGQLQLKEMAERVEGKVTQPVDIELSVSLSERFRKAEERLNGRGNG